MQGNRGRGQRIADVVLAYQPQRNLGGPTRGDQPKGRPSLVVDPDVFTSNVRRPARPKVTTGTETAAAMAATSGSSAFKHRNVTRSPGDLGFGGGDRFTAAELTEMRRANVEHDPNRRRRDRAQPSQVADPRAPISSTSSRVSRSHRQMVRGTPRSLLYEPTGAIVGPSAGSIEASRSFVVVLPVDPVTATTRKPGSRRITSAAI